MHKLIVRVATVGTVAGMLWGGCSRISGLAADLFISDHQEVAMGHNFREQIESDPDNFPLYRNREGHNPAVLAYIDSLGQFLAGVQRERPQIAYHFDVIDNDSVINAFAVPGGFVYVYTGLLLAARNEAELAGVLAHEIAHITRRHGAKRLISAYGYNFALDLVFGDSTALRSVMDVASGLMFLKYSRDDEFEADSFAVNYLTDAGYNPKGMQTFLELLEQASSPAVLTLLSTHPPTDQRIEAVAVQIGRLGAGVRNRSVPPLAHLP